MRSTPTIVVLDVACALLWVPVFGWGTPLGGSDLVALTGLALLGVAAAATGWVRDPRATGAGLTILTAAAAVHPLPWNPLAVIVVVGLWFAARVIRSQVDLARDLRARAAELAAESAYHAAQAVRRDRARVAREMHDIVAHAVSIMVVQAGAGQLQELDAEQRARLRSLLHEVSGNALSDLARLRDVVTAERLSAEALEAIAERTRRAGNPVEVSAAVEYATLGDDVAIALRRTVEEACTNAVKHAPGAPISIRLDEIEGVVRVSVTNGPPRRRPLRDLSSGHGLDGLHERLTELRGTFEASSRGPQGWQVTARAPVAG